MAALVREALDSTGHLVRLEVALAREELRAEVLRAKEATIAFACASAAGLVGLALLLVALALAFSQAWLASLCIGAILLLVGAALGATGWRALPKPLPQTTSRVQADVQQLKERVA